MGQSSTVPIQIASTRPADRAPRELATPRGARRLLLGLLLVEAAFVALFGLTALPGAPQTFTLLFDLDAEVSLPAWFSSLQLGAVGLLFALMARPGQGPSGISSGTLLLAAAAFLFLSADEAAAVHEKVSSLLKQIEWTPRFKGNHGLWIPAYFALGVVLLVATRPTLEQFRTRLPRETALLATGSLIFLAGAVGLEIVGYELLRDGSTPRLYRAEVALEEFLEMAGISVVLYATLLISCHGSGDRPQARARPPGQLRARRP